MLMLRANDAHDAHLGPGIGTNCSSRLQAGARMMPMMRANDAHDAHLGPGIGTHDAHAARK